MLGFRPHGGPQGEAEVAWAQRQAGMMDIMGAYLRLQMSKPQSIAWMGAGNPVGQAAWILERFHDWSDLSKKHTLDEAYGKDALITNIMLYVMTDSFATGAWYYRGLVEEKRPQPSSRASAARRRPPSPISPASRSIRRRPGRSRSGHTTSPAGPKCRAAATSRRWRSRTSMSKRCGTGRAASSVRQSPMPAVVPPVRPITLAEIEAARGRIAGTCVRTPLVKLELGPGFPDIRLKLENLQPINAYKLRGAANAVAMLSDAEREKGVWTISAGNAGQGVAYAARKAGVPCTVVAIETAPASKLDRMRGAGRQAGAGVL